MLCLFLLFAQVVRVLLMARFSFGLTLAGSLFTFPIRIFLGLQQSDFGLRSFGPRLRVFCSGLRSPDYFPGHLRNEKGLFEIRSMLKGLI